MASSGNPIVVGNVNPQVYDITLGPVQGSLASIADNLSADATPQAVDWRTAVYVGVSGTISSDSFPPDPTQPRIDSPWLVGTAGELIATAGQDWQRGK